MSSGQFAKRGGANQGDATKRNDESAKESHARVLRERGADDQFVAGSVSEVVDDSIFSAVSSILHSILLRSSA